MFRKVRFHKNNNIKLIVSDFDGVFTDGTISVDENMVTSKIISFKDIMGVSQALKKGYNIAIISGEKTKAIDFIANKFEKLETFQDIRPKYPVLKSLMKKYSLDSDEVIYIGDDTNDVECLNSVKYKITVPNANSLVKKLKGIKITKVSGGNGAFREVIDELLSKK